MKKIEFTNGTTIDGASTFNQMQDNIENVFNGEEAMGSIVVDDITCKNLLKCTVENQTKNGITVTVNEDKSFHIKGTATATTIFIFGGGFLNLTLDAGSYTLSTGNATPSGVYINAYHSSSTLLTQIVPTTKQRTFNVAEKTTYIGFRIECYINSGVTIDMTIKPMLEKGSVATEYVEHKEYANKEVYSTKEQEVGTWVDEAPIYKKTIDFGILPNATSKKVAHGISNLRRIVKIEAIATTGENFFTLPFLGTEASLDITMYANKTNILITAPIDRSSYSAYVTLYYVKSTTSTASVDEA